MRPLLLPWLLFLSLLVARADAGAAEDTLWSKLRQGGYVILVRHTDTDPGVGDPADFRLEDCTTQRNLSEEGREQARRLGENFRLYGIPVGEVLASPWCRCIETASLAFGSADPAPMLSNLWGRAERRARQVAQIRAYLAKPPSQGNAVLVTHGTVILALTGLSAATGELVILEPLGGGRFAVAGRLGSD